MRKRLRTGLKALPGRWPFRGVRVPGCRGWLGNATYALDLTSGPGQPVVRDQVRGPFTARRCGLMSLLQTRKGTRGIRIGGVLQPDSLPRRSRPDRGCGTMQARKCRSLCLGGAPLPEKQHACEQQQQGKGSQRQVSTGFSQSFRILGPRAGGSRSRGGPAR